MTNYPKAFIQKIYGEEKIWQITKKYQKKAGIVFESMTPELLIEILQNKKKFKKILFYFGKYFSEVQKITSYEAYISRIDFSRLLFKLFTYGAIEIPGEESIWSIFDVVTLINNKRYYASKEFEGKPDNNIEDGIYIKIGPINSISEIEKYTHEKANSILLAQKTFTKIKNKQYPHIKECGGDFNLNIIIDEFYKKKNKDIPNINAGNITRYKSNKIKNILNIQKESETIERQHRRREKIKRTLVDHK